MITREQVEKRVSAFMGACRRQGVKATHQRLEILRELAGTDQHPDAETVYAHVRRQLPTVSLDTVYRTLRLLEEKGVIARVGAFNDRARFDANTERHLHFVCSECGLVGDIQSGTLSRFAAPAEVDAIGSVDSVYIELRGRCRKCQQKRPGPPG